MGQSALFSHTERERSGKTSLISFDNSYAEKVNVETIFCSLNLCGNGHRSPSRRKMIKLKKKAANTRPDDATAGHDRIEREYE